MQKVTVQLVDDFDGAVIEEGKGRSITFSLDGTSYEIDLSNDNLRQFRNVLEPYMSVARAKRKAGSSQKSNSVELQAIRDWASANNVHVSDRGRISATVREAYAAAH